MSSESQMRKTETKESTGFGLILVELYAACLGLFLALVSAVNFIFIRLKLIKVRRRKESQTLVEPEKREFLKEFGEYYGYSSGPVSVDQLRSSEFPQLKGTVYLDHAGATLYSKSQLQEALADCSAHIYGNPHSQSESSQRTSDAVEFARRQVLEYFHAPVSEYACIFTSGATAALKLVGETFPWSCDSHFFYTMENHNSVLGIREYALAAGAKTAALSFHGKDHTMQPSWMQTRGTVGLQQKDGETYNLFAMPTECNFSGAKFGTEVIKTFQESELVNGIRGRCMILLDAAKSAGTSPPDVTRYSADFVVVSFYKIFGYPTGLGALIVRRDAARLLHKGYFGGGTVSVSIAGIDYVKRRESIEQRMEDGTVSFLSIRALSYGFSAIKRAGLDDIARHTWALTHYTASTLSQLQHSNGTAVCCLYGNHGMFKSFSEEFDIQGPVITFNLRRPDGSWIGHREVEKVASLCQIHLRTGCFCNPGACSKYLNLSNQDLKTNFEAGHVCWDDRDIISGRPTGAVRISFGYMSTFEDCQEFLRFVRKYFVNYTDRQEDVGKQRTDSGVCAGVQLKGIIVYPIKSCAGFSVQSWPVSSSGLLYDREWLICDAQNAALTQKKVPSMCMISAYVDLISRKLVVRSPSVDDALEIPLEDTEAEPSAEVVLCGERAKCKSYDLAVSEWFTKALGVECSLIRRGLESSKACHWRSFEEPSLNPKRHDTSSFVNEGQFLLLSEASVKDLSSRASMSHDGPKLQIDPKQFRPNLIISGAKPYEEDNWQTVRIGNVHLPIIGGCNRCRMITVDQTTGQRSSNGEPLLTLASYRRSKGKILFGVLLGVPFENSTEDERRLTVGSEVNPN